MDSIVQNGNVATAHSIPNNSHSDDNNKKSDVSVVKDGLYADGQHTPGNDANPTNIVPNASNVSNESESPSGSHSSQSPAIICDGNPTVLAPPISTSTSIKDEDRERRLLFTWIRQNCILPFYYSFHERFLADTIQHTISVVPIMFCQYITHQPYIACRNLPPSAFASKRVSRRKKKSWRSRIFSLEGLCVVSLCATVFTVGMLGASDDRSNHHNRNGRKPSRNNQKHYRQRQQQQQKWQPSKYIYGRS